MTTNRDSDAALDTAMDRAIDHANEMTDRELAERCDLPRQLRFAAAVKEMLPMHAAIMLVAAERLEAWAALLAACEMIVRWHDRPDGDTAPNFVNVLAAALYGIAKAKGRTGDPGIGECDHYDSDASGHCRTCKAEAVSIFANVHPIIAAALTPHIAPITTRPVAAQDPCPVCNFTPGNCTCADHPPIDGDYIHHAQADQAIHDGAFRPAGERWIGNELKSRPMTEREGGGS